MTLLDQSSWQGRVFSGGWIEPGAGHAAVQDSVYDEYVSRLAAAGARLTAGGTYEGLFYAPTVLAEVGVSASGTGARFGGSANLDAFTDTRWVTIRGDIAFYPF
jgi:acyl-CoA reductase-like NAD-dependent aldehyde dehydrogenase